MPFSREGHLSVAGERVGVRPLTGSVSSAPFLRSLGHLAVPGDQTGST